MSRPAQGTREALNRPQGVRAHNVPAAKTALGSARRDAVSEPARDQREHSEGENEEGSHGDQVGDRLAPATAGP